MDDSMRKVITSEELSKSLDVDYSEDKLKEKIQYNKRYIAKMYECYVMKYNKFTRCIFLVGSKAEGISSFLESDWDLMYAENAIICFENVEHLDRESNQFLKLDRTDAPAGYCFLYPLDTDNKTGSWWDDHVLQEFHSSAGPAHTDCLNNKITIHHLKDNYHKTFNSSVNSSIDNVLAYACYLPELKKAWCERRRNYDWPSQKTIQHVATLPVHVVHAGLKGSENQENQWRICFTLAELHLIQSLNNTQTKVYVCLKRIAKHYLNPIDDTVTSYLVKT